MIPDTMLSSMAEARPSRLHRHEISGRSFARSQLVTQVRATDVLPAREEQTSPLRREDRGAVAVLTLDRPEARNSLSEDLIAALHGAIETIGRDDAIRAIVITGAGSAFSSGHDLKELTAPR
jgi:hypothetical protein